MAFLGMFKSKSSPARTALVGAPAPTFYDMLAKKVTAEGATLPPDSVENIRSLLAPLTKMGADIDAQLAKIKIEIDKSGRPSTLIVRTTVDGKPMGPQTTFTITPVQGEPGVTGPACRVTGTMSLPASGGITDRLLMAGISRKLETDSKLAFDQPIADAAKTLGASVRFES